MVKHQHCILRLARKSLFSTNATNFYHRCAFVLDRLLHLCCWPPVLSSQHGSLESQRIPRGIVVPGKDFVLVSNMFCFDPCLAWSYYVLGGWRWILYVHIWCQERWPMIFNIPTSMHPCIHPSMHACMHESADIHTKHIWYMIYGIWYMTYAYKQISK